MEKPRAIKPEESDAAIKLINRVFRNGAGLASTMQYEYPVLLSLKNCENRRAIFDNGEPVACLNIYKANLNLFGHEICMAFIGAVATHPDYRRRGLAGSLIEDAEEKMMLEGVDAIVISGNYDIYTSRGYTFVHKYKQFIINQSIAGNAVDVEEAVPDAELIHKILPLYLREPVRFYRSFNDYLGLYKGSVYEWGETTYKSFLIKRDGYLQGSFILRIDTSGKAGSIVEWVGDRQAILDGIKAVYRDYGLNEISAVVSPWDEQIVHLFEKDGLQAVPSLCGHTLKVVNFEKLMGKVSAYADEILDNSAAGRLSGSEQDGKFIIKLGKKTVIETKDIRDINLLLFGNGPENADYAEYAAKYGDLLKDVFPLPLPYLYNLNHI